MICLPINIDRLFLCLFILAFSLPQVWFREGICHDNPEGSLWEEMSIPGEVVQISCGPAELVWAVLWEGQFIVREGISRDCPKGKDSAGRGEGVVGFFQSLY